MKRLVPAVLALLLLWGCCGRFAVRAEAFPEDSAPDTAACATAAASDGLEEPELYMELATDDWFPLLTAALIVAAAAVVIVILFIRRKRR